VLGDPSNEEVLDEISPKQVLDMLSSFSKIVGLMVDKRG